MVTSPQLSEAMASSMGISSEHSTVWSAGTKVNSGAVVSCTVMVWTAVALFPASSEAAKVRTTT